MVTPSSRRVKRRKQRFGGAPQDHHRVRDPVAEGTGPQGTPHFAQSLPLYTPTARLKGWDPQGTPQAFLSSSGSTPQAACSKAK